MTPNDLPFERLKPALRRYDPASRPSAFELTELERRVFARIAADERLGLSPLSPFGLPAWMIAKAPKPWIAFGGSLMAVVVLCLGFLSFHEDATYQFAVTSSPLETHLLALNDTPASYLTDQTSLWGESNDTE